VEYTQCSAFPCSAQALTKSEKLGTGIAYWARCEDTASHIPLRRDKRDVREGLLGQDHKLLSPIYTSSFIFLQTGERRQEIREGLKLNKKRSLDVPTPVTCSPHHIRQD
jgi:hypothetical protein